MAGWTTPRTWVAGEKPPAATMNAHIRDNLNALNGFVRKTADESVTSSAVLQNDNQLTLAIGAAGTYVFEVGVFAASAANSAGDINIGFSFPTGTLHFGGPGIDGGIAGASVAQGSWLGALSATSGTTGLGSGLSTATNFYTIRGILIATATGNLQMMWAQLVSNANATTVKAGSWMTMKQVA